MTPAVEITDLSKSYGTVRALHDISLRVNRGELFGLIGPDGAGKSTLYRILATILRPDAGKATILGLDTVTDFRRIRDITGYMPERFSLYPDLSVMENLRFFAALFGVSVRENYDMIEPVFRQLASFPDRRAGDLSGGMKQKLALSCALIHRPEILLLDEPTTGVDAVSRSEFWAILDTLRKKGLTVLVSTSYMDEANLCDRIAMIEGGTILCTDTPANLVTRLDERLFNAEASDMFSLLNHLRAMPDVIRCYTFGATLHAAVTPSFDPSGAVSRLTAEGVTDVRIYPASGTIEDLFIKLTLEHEQH